MKDAANLILRDKNTGEPALYIDYANATSSEWTSESVYALRKGTNAIRWDNARNGTLTLDTELFDFGLLAMIMGADVKEGKSDIFKRVDATLDSTRAIRIGDGFGVDETTISVIKLRNGQNDTEHTGRPLYNASAAQRNLPGQITDLSISAADTTARINFPRVNGATGYIIERDGASIAEQSGNEYTDTGLSPEMSYSYTVHAYNEYGAGAKSPLVEVDTAVEGTTSTTTFTATSEARIEAVNNVGTVSQPDPLSVTYSYTNGIIQFSENAVPQDAYAVYFMTEVDNVRTLEIQANKFAGAYEIFADALIRPQDGSLDQIVQIHYFNARPQSNFTLTQSATEPTSLSIVFDLLPEGDKLAEFKVMQ